MVETPGQLSRRIRAIDDVPEDTLYFVPNLIVRVIPAVVQVLLSRLKQIRRRHGIFIPLIPGAENFQAARAREAWSPAFRRFGPRRSSLFESPELVFRNLF